MTEKLTAEELRSRSRVAEVVQVYGGMHARHAYERDVQALEALRRIVRRALECGQLEKLEDARPYLEEQESPSVAASAPACTCGAQYSARAHEKHCAFQVWSFGQALTPEVKAIVDRFGCPHGYFKHECEECKA